MINLGFKWTEYPVLKHRLKDAYDVAIDRLKAVPECRQMFVQLGEDGLRALTTTVYVRAIPRMEATWCRHAWSGTGGARLGK